MQSLVRTVTHYRTCPLCTGPHGQLLFTSAAEEIAKTLHGHRLPIKKQQISKTSDRRRRACHTHAGEYTSGQCEVMLCTESNIYWHGNVKFVLRTPSECYHQWQCFGHRSTCCTGRSGTPVITIHQWYRRYSEHHKLGNGSFIYVQRDPFLNHPIPWLTDTLNDCDGVNQNGVSQLPAACHRYPPRTVFLGKVKRRTTGTGWSRTSWPIRTYD